MRIQGVSRRVFEIILQDANVLDVDFSRWHDGIALVLDADHVDPPAGEDLAYFRVTFVDVGEFVFQPRTRERLGDGRHPRLSISGCVAERAGDLVVELNGPAYSLSPTIFEPLLRIVCGSIRVEPMSRNTLERVSPGHLEGTDNGLVRPSIDVLARKIRGQ
ncbi:MAG: hypothetical protein RIB58_01265 [Phycisphaerales bacterium]